MHQGFPAQLEGWTQALIQDGHRIIALHQQPCSLQHPNLRLLRWHPSQANGRDTFRDAREFESKLIRAAAVADCAELLAKQGVKPDLVIAHPGWGETLYLKSIWPETPQLLYLEHFYNEQEVAPLLSSEEPNSAAWRGLRRRIPGKNAGNLLALHDMHTGVSPTQFQASSFPSQFQSQIAVIHDGIDLSEAKPNPQASFTLPDGRILRQSDPVLTFVNRSFEPYRGFPQMMRALPAIQKQLPNLDIIMIGKEQGVSYGQSPKDGRSWKEVLLEEVGDQINLNRIHFTGKLNREPFLRALQISSCHVYLTAPFVLSWSCLEAIACAAPLVASATAPVQEVVNHQDEALLVGFDDQDALVNAVTETIAHPEEAKQRALRALKRIERNYCKRKCTQYRVRLSDQLLYQND